MRKLGIVCLFVGFITHQALAAIEVYSFEDPENENRYRNLVAELRCPKCQNQNLADSDAPLAKDIKDIIYDKIQSGESEEDIVDYMVSRYGDFIRYRPPFIASTAFLWLFPCFLLVVFAVIVSAIVKRQRAEPVGEDRDALHEKAVELQRGYDQERNHVEDS